MRLSIGNVLYIILVRVASFLFPSKKAHGKPREWCIIPNILGFSKVEKKASIAFWLLMVVPKTHD
jgi:hypothetical protein